MVVMMMMPLQSSRSHLLSGLFTRSQRLRYASLHFSSVLPNPERILLQEGLCHNATLSSTLHSAVVLAGGADDAGRSTITRQQPAFLRTTRRTFAAFGTNWKETSKQSKKKIKNNPKNPEKKSTTAASTKPEADESSSSSTRSTAVPTNTISPLPLFMIPTASPHVFVARAAAAQQAGIFADHAILNTMTRPKCRFEYLGSAVNNKDNNNGAGDRDRVVYEVAVLGRSNVGKSSLLNALMGQSLARTGKQPGRTQQANYYGWMRQTNNNSTTTTTSTTNDNLLGCLVDLPGYGYAVGPDAAVDRWQQRTQAFLLRQQQNQSLKRVYLLVDARHVVTDFDTTVMGWLDEGQLPYTIVLTKCDAVSVPTVIKHVNQVCMRYQHQSQHNNMNHNSTRRRSNNSSKNSSYPVDDDDDEEEEMGDDTTGTYMSPVVHVTSSKKGLGVLELLRSIETEFYDN